MKAITCLAGALFALTASIGSSLAQAPKPGIERMYVLYCGDIALTDMRLASETRSATVFMGCAGCTTIATGAIATSAIGVKSRSAS